MSILPPREVSGATDTEMGAVRARYAQIDARLDAGVATPEALDRLKQEIIELYKTIDHRVSALVLLKDEVKGLVAKWKTVQQAAGSAAPPPDAAPIVHYDSARTDTLGASTFIDRGWSRISVGDYEGAEEALVRALELAPDDSQAESLLGWARMLQDHYGEALGHFQRVLAREPTNALARINLGYIALKQGAFAEAIEHLAKAIRLDNDRKATLYAHFYLGLVYLERAMYEDAEVFFQKALGLGPNLIEAWYELGRARWLAGDRDGARAAWESGQDANRFNAWATRCGALLDSIAAGVDPLGREPAAP